MDSIEEAEKTMKDKLTGRNKIIQSIIGLVPRGMRLWLNPNYRSVVKFMQYAASTTAGGSTVLDAGAGPGPYKSLFAHCKYEATDFKPAENIDFICSLNQIPKANGTYSHIICTEVLEHVEYPQEVMNEFFNILKKGGKLYLTCPQGWGLHQEPYNYYNFTKYGLKSLLKNAGFKEENIYIQPKGGYFWMMSNIIRASTDQMSNWNIFKWIMYPFTSILIPLILFPLDILDKKQIWTNGYLVEAKK